MQYCLQNYDEISSSLIPLPKPISFIVKSRSEPNLANSPVKTIVYT